MDPQKNDSQSSQSGGMNNPPPMDAGHNRTLMAVLAYLGILIIIPFLMAKNDPFVKFHIKQGLVLVIVEVILWVIGGMFIWQLWGVIQLINLATIVFAIIGIVNVINHKEQELPLIGGLAKNFTF